MPPALARTGWPRSWRVARRGAVPPGFERITGLASADIAGRTVREVLQVIEPAWIEVYGRVALTGEPVFFEDYSQAMDKYFEVSAFRPAPMQFACIFSDDCFF